jgi:septal ring factor EnvC (AmiA/AmiB activator)
MTSEADDDIVARLRGHFASPTAMGAADEIERLRGKVVRLEALPAHLEREIQRLTDAQESTEYALRVVTDELTKARAEILRLRAPRLAE